jgi:two-component system, NarL family, sensor histidine kinase UhpB
MKSVFPLFYLLHKFFASSKIQLILLCFINWPLFAGGHNATAVVDSLKKLVQVSEKDTDRVNILIELSDALIGSYPEQAIIYGQESLALATELKWTKGIASSQRIIGKVYAMGMGDPQKALLHLHPALNTFRRIKWQKGEGMTLSNIGTAWYYQNEVDSAMKYWTEAHDILRKIKDSKEAVKVQLNLGNAWREKGDADKALYYYEQSANANHSVGNKDSEAKSHFNSGMVYLSMGDIPKSLKAHIKALFLWESVGNKNGIASSYSQIAEAYRINGEFAKALKYAQMAVKTAQELKNKIIEQETLLILGMVYADQNNFDQALDAYQAVLDIGKTGGNNRTNATAYRNTGEIYAKKKEQLPALHNYLQALSISAQQKSTGYIIDLEKVGKQYLSISLMEDVSNLPDSLQDKRKLRMKAEHYLTEAAELGKNFKYILAVKNAHESLSELYKLEGKWQKAFNQYVAFKTLQDTIFSNDTRVEIARLEAKREVDLQQSKIEIQKLELQAAQKERWLIIGSSVLVLALAGVSFNRYRMKQQSKRVLEMERVRLRISRDLHDDIGSTLSSINLISHSAKKKLGAHELDKTKVHLDNIEERTQHILGNMRDIVWNIQPQNDTLSRLLQRMEETAVTILEAKNISCSFSFPKNNINVALPIDLKRNLFLIFKEALNNISKHSGCTHAEISLNIEKNILYMQVKDNGNGIPEENQAGNGLQNMKYRAEEVNATFEMQSAKGKGTAILFTAKLPQKGDNFFNMKN